MKRPDHPDPCVCHEPEPVARAWEKIRAELHIYVLHHDRQRVFDIVAHELAEQIRTHADSDDLDYYSPQGLREAADLIDPEVQR
ncbi:hypothetical protein [Streptomyces antibioticus]|uniref:hypothetical protein n=1 Tax=Streptomyces antibioticus TaxID=1890 RepID=UPI0033B268D5